MKYFTVVFIASSIFIFGCSSRKNDQHNIKSVPAKNANNFQNNPTNNYDEDSLEQNEFSDLETDNEENYNDENNIENDDYLNENMMHRTKEGYLIGKYHENEYGLGVHSDGTGRAFEWQTTDGQKVDIFKVDPNGYGPGVGMDEFGRPVYPNPR